MNSPSQLHPNSISRPPTLSNSEGERLSRELKTALVELSRAVVAVERASSVISSAARQLDFATDRARRPLPRSILEPQPKHGPANLPKGEREILRVMREEGGEVDAETIMRRTGYAPSSVRTFLPHLRERGLVHHTLNIAL